MAGKKSAPRKHMGDELRQSEEKYRTILEDTGLGYFEVDLKGNFTFVNDVECNNLQYSREELIGMNNRQYTTAEEAKKVLKAFNHLYRTGESCTVLEYEVTRKDGTKSVIEMHVSLMKDSNGKPIGFRGITIQITERNRAESLLRESDERYKALFDRSLDIVFICDFEGRIIDANDVGLNRLGYKKEETPPLNFVSLLSEDQLPLAFKTLQEIQETGIQKEPTEFRLQHRNGSIVYVETTGFAIISNGRPTAILSIARDITKRKQAESQREVALEALRQSEEKYRTFIETINDGYYEIDLTGKYTFVNDVICEHLRYPKEELIGMTNRQYQTEANAKKSYQIFTEVFRTGNPVKAFEMEIIRKDGTIQISEISISLIRDTKGNPIAFRGTSRDITERKQMEENLRQSEERYRTIIENIGDGYFETDLAGQFTFVNDAQCKNTGTPREQLLGQSNKDYTSEEESKRLREVFSKIYKTGEPAKGFSFSFTKRNGTEGFHEISVSLIRNAKGTPTGFRGISRDVTERKQMEENLRQSEERYRTIIEEMEDWYFEADLSGTITFCNDIFATILGYFPKELVGRNYRNIITKGDSDWIYGVFNQVYKTGSLAKNIPREFVRPDGSIISAEFSIFAKRDPQGNIIGFRGMGHDVTEKRKMQLQLMQSDKMASIGQLAAGVAHEINNPISFVSSNLKTLSEYSNDIVRIFKLTRSLTEIIEKENMIKSNLLNKRLEEIKNLESVMKIDFLIEDLNSLIKESQEGANRIIRIVRDLKTYAHPGGENLLLADINENIESTLNIVWNEIKYKADVHKEYGNIPKIYCHPQELNQVFMNILVNAAQAIEDKGEIRISTRLDPQDNIEIRIQDNGFGIPEENLSKLFNPFFTTKDIGKGTGLGLHVAFSMVQKHHGNIEVESKLGVGTTFIIKIPAKQATPQL